MIKFCDWMGVDDRGVVGVWDWGIPSGIFTQKVSNEAKSEAYSCQVHVHFILNLQYINLLSL